VSALCRCVTAGGVLVGRYEVFGRRLCGLLGRTRIHGDLARLGLAASGSGIGHASNSDIAQPALGCLDECRIWICSRFLTFGLGVDRQLGVLGCCPAAFLCLAFAPEEAFGPRLTVDTR
jgi:hypothetical protein